MANVRDRIFVGGGAPVSDINSMLDALATSVVEEVDGMAPEVYATVTAAKRPLKPFIVGFIPPDVQVNFVAFNQDRNIVGTVGGVRSTSQSTVAGQSVSGGTKITGTPGAAGTVFSGPPGPVEMTKTETIISQQALGASIYGNLKARGFSDADAKRLTPLFIGQANAELARDAQGNFKTHNFNIGNVHSRGPGQGGYYYTGKDSRGNSEPGYDPRPGADNSYTTYYVAAPDLDHGVDRWVGATLGWKNVRNASNGQEFAAALRPDLFPESRGGNNGAYFTAGKTQEEVFAGYGRNVQGAADRFAANNRDFTRPDPNGVVVGGGQEIASSLLPTQANGPGARASIMSNGEVTTLEEDDPIGGRTGRNIRLSKDARAGLVDKQVRELIEQIRAVAATPSLYLLISPQSFQRGYEHTVDAPKGRRRHIVHTWLEKPMTITAKGVTAAQYVFNSQGDGGLTHQKRVHTVSYRNLMSLVRIYKNNGWLYTRKEGLDESRNAGIRQIAMSIFIYYDGHVYIGSFDDFSITDSADKPYNLEYSFKFTVRYDSDVTSVTDGEVARSIRAR